MKEIDAILIIFLLPPLLLMGHKQPPAPMQVKGEQYVPGQIVVGFADTVSLTDAKSFIAEQGLEPVEWQFNSMISLWAEADSGKADSYLKALRADSTVLRAEKRGYAGTDKKPDKTYLQVQFNLRATEQSTETLLQSMPGLFIKNRMSKPKWAVIAVPEGQEQAWIDKLKAFPFVRYAELNTVVHVDENKR